MLVVAVGIHLQQNRTEEASALLQQARDGNSSAPTHAVIAFRNAIDAIVSGNRDPGLANDPALDPITAVELQLLLESLSAPK